MSIRTTLNVSLTVELGEYIERQVKAGRYRTASELVRCALRMLQESEEMRPVDPTAGRNADAAR